MMETLHNGIKWRLFLKSLNFLTSPEVTKKLPRCYIACPGTEEFFSSQWWSYLWLIHLTQMQSWVWIKVGNLITYLSVDDHILVKKHLKNMSE